MRRNITRRGKSSWRLKLDLELGQDGERRTRVLTVNGTRKEAEAELARLLNEANKGTSVEPTKG